MPEMSARTEVDRASLHGALADFTLELRVDYEETTCGFKDFRSVLRLRQEGPLWSNTNRQASIVEIDHSANEKCTCPEGKVGVQEDSFTVKGAITMIETTPSVSIPLFSGVSLSLPSLQVNKIDVVIYLIVLRGGATRSDQTFDGMKVDKHGKPI